LFAQTLLIVLTTHENWQFVSHASLQCVSRAHHHNRDRPSVSLNDTNNTRTTQTVYSTEAWTGCCLIVLDHLYLQKRWTESLTIQPVAEKRIWQDWCFPAVFSGAKCRILQIWARVSIISN